MGSRLALLRGALLVLLVAAHAATAAADVPYEVVHLFPTGPLRPVVDVPLIEGADGSLYGITSGEGLFDRGTFYKIDPEGTATVLYSFRPEDGASPVGLARGADGNFYGVTGLATFAPILPRFFRATTAGVVTFLSRAPTVGVNAPTEGEPFLEGADGNLYWFTSGTGWRITPSGVFSRLDQVNHLGIRSAVAMPDGSFYAAWEALFPHHGQVLKIDPAGNVSTTYSFTGGTNGSRPAALVLATDGNFYGTTTAGGAFGFGTLFRLTPAGVLNTLYAFPVITRAPHRIFEASDGFLYGVSGEFSLNGFQGVPFGTGAILRMALDGTVSTLRAQLVDGAVPASLMQAADGTFFGTTKDGGPHRYGSIFELENTGAVTTLRIFVGPEGLVGLECQNPCRIPGLIEASDGNFYGTAMHGGRLDRGTVFRMTPAGAVTVLHEFTGPPDGLGPQAQLLQASDGHLYGTTQSGGLANNGTVFRVTLDGTFTTLHALSQAVDGFSPRVRLVQGADGALYGTTPAGGPGGAGTVFRMTLGGAFSTLYAFSNEADGGNPLNLVKAADGNIYGIAQYGGNLLGLVFRITPQGGISVLHAFASAEGRWPTNLVAGSDGHLYGVLMSTSNVSLCQPRVFRLTVTGRLTILRDFNASCSEGLTMVEGRDGSFYISGTLGPGTPSGTPVSSVYRMGLDGGMEQMLTFPPGGLPSVMVEASDGRLYGVRAWLPGFFPPSAGRVFRIGRVPPSFPVNLRSTLTMFRPSTGRWVARTGESLTLGATGDIPVAADYTGDGVLDAAAYRPGTGVWSIAGVGLVRLGAAGDIPVPADYDGDGRTDPAVFRPSTGTWYINGRTPAVFGGAGDVPVPGDYTGSGRAQIAVSRRGTWYVSGQIGAHVVGTRPEDIPVPADFDGDGRLDMAVYRRTTGEWIVRNPFTGLAVTTMFGSRYDLPAPQDLDGDGRAELIVFRRGSGTWFSHNTRTYETAATQFGAPGDLPIFAPRGLRTAAGDFDGDRRTDLAVYRPAGLWFSPGFESQLGGIAVPFGGADSDRPMPADYDGDGLAEPAVFRRLTSDWWLRSWLTGQATSASWGNAALGDLVTAADFDGDGVADLAAFRPSTGQWFTRRSLDGALLRVPFGGVNTSAVPAPADFDGDGRADAAIFRPSTGEWFVVRSSDGTGLSTTTAAGDVPVPADYDGDGKADVASFSPTTGVWQIVLSATGNVAEAGWGNPALGDTPTPGDYDGDGAADIAVYRRTTGEWFILDSSTRSGRLFQWGSPPHGDVPALAPATP